MIEKRYEEAKKEFNEIYAKPIAQKRNWQIFAMIQMIVIGILIASYVNLANKSLTVPYIVEVDKFGRAQYADVASQTKIDDERIIRAHLIGFISKARSVITDEITMKRNFEEVYKIADTNVKNNFLDEYYRETKPFQKASKESTQIEIRSFLRQGEHNYLVEWTEVTRDLTAKRINEENWQALISITQIPYTNAKGIEDNPLNPFGIYVTSLSWSKLK